MITIDNEKMGKILGIVLKICFVLFIPIMVVLPFFLDHNISIIHPMLIIYPNGIIMLGIIIQFMRLFRSLENNQPFTFENVKVLKTTSYLSFGMCFLWIIDLLDMLFIIQNHYVNYIIVLLFLAVLFFGVGIALHILSLLFQQATNYKIENDLTI